MSNPLWSPTWTHRLVLSLALLIPGSVWAAVPTMTFDEVRTGMRGTGRTVFEGERIESFDVEIIGKLAHIGPGQNLILARLDGGPLARTGVLSGMSGSPVTIDGRLIGAVAYSWGFSKEPIAGITPIAEMLSIRTPSGARAARPAAGTEHGEELLLPLRSTPALDTFVDDRLLGPFRRPGGALPLSLPLSISGLGAAGLGRIAPWLDDAGFVPLQAGSSGGAGPSRPLEPGSPIGVKLVRGDLEMTATGTVTWVEGDQVLAFGHPLFQLGNVDLPMTGARVETLLPSLMQSSRIATPLDELGALRQDRAAGIFGRLGARPRMIPVRFALSGPEGGDEVFSFDVVDDPLLSPLLLYVSLNGILASRERSVGHVTVQLREGSIIKMTEGDDVLLDNLYSGPSAFNHGTGIAAYILHLLMNNNWSRPEIAGINLMLDYDDEPRTARIRRASVDRYRVRPGETVEAAIVIAPFRGSPEIVTRSIAIPEETPAGPLMLHVGGAQAVSREEESFEPVLPRDLDQLILLINRLRRNDRVYVAATREDTGVLLNGARLPTLPPSVARVLSRPRSRGNFIVIPRRSVLEEAIATPYAVSGAARIELEVVTP